MFDARTGGRAAIVALAASLLAVLALRSMQWNDPKPQSRSGAMHAAHGDGPPAGLAAAAAADATRHDRIAVYRGLGTWIDIYDVAWRHPGAAVRKMAARGVRTLYLQTSNFSRGKPFVYRDGVGRFLDAAHRFGVDVVAWYLPGFRDVSLDVHRSLAAIRFRSPRGEAFDSYALDIESPEVRRASTRTRRLLTVSSRLRRAVGPEYPLGAIVPSPRGLDYPGSYWPGFPFRVLARTYDVFLPMTYFTWRVSGEHGAHWYTAQNIGIIRRRTGDQTVPIHVIGGIGASRGETRGFVEAVRERGILGASYYTFPTTPPDDWQPLQHVTPIPDQRPALPVGIPYEAALGNVPGGDTTHPKEVVYKVGGRRGRYRVACEGFDIQTGEVTLLVNWRVVAPVPAGVRGGWADVASVAVPPGLLRRDATNYVSFVVNAANGEWPTWGVRSVRLVRPGKDVRSRTASAQSPTG
jgi:hypothetical protein